jgi:hypothetical protein
MATALAESGVRPTSQERTKYLCWPWFTARLLLFQVLRVDIASAVRCRKIPDKPL